MRILGVDTGGTFTDLVLTDGEQSRVAKVPSTPDDPGRAVLDGLALLGGAGAGDHVVHGTTVALNALLTGNVARTALVTGTGFRDLIEIGRQDRPDIYALHPRRSAALVPRNLRFELPQRTWPDPETGQPIEVERPTDEDLAQVAERVRRSGAKSVAVCLLHSFADPAIEERVAAALRPLGIPVTTSAGILPEYREYERFSTATVNAVLVPLMRAYLGPLEERLGGARLSILQSNGGTLPAARAGDEPVRVLLSGPAGGVVGATRAAREAGFGRVVTLDMGGTSTDVAFHDARPSSERELAATTVSETHVGGHPVGVPSLDIHTIGCGGGSLVSVDAGGVLHVGPESAGADPGPVAYGRSEQPTVTDAHVFLGHVRQGGFLDGFELDHDAVARAFERLSGELGVSAPAAARGVLEVARAAMRRAVGVMTLQRGVDPARLALAAFGGAGGLHAAALAEALRIPAALVPSRPGVLSAAGMAAADALREHARTVLEPLSSWTRKRRTDEARALAAAGRASLTEAGHGARRIAVETLLDLRYSGQSFELRLPDGPRRAAAFHEAHERIYGYALPDREVELVCVRVRARVRSSEQPLERVRRRALPRAALVGEAPVDFGRRVSTAIIDRAALKPGHAFAGPALVQEYSGTTLVPPGWHARVTAGGHLVLESGEGG